MLIKDHSFRFKQQAENSALQIAKLWIDEREQQSKAHPNP
jgi:hypothetical protein